MVLSTLTEFVWRLLRPAILLVCTGSQLLHPSPVRTAELALGVDLPRGTMAAHWYDDHGGFHGDGCAYGEFETYWDLFETFDPQAAGWQALPLSEDVQTAFYGRTATDENGVEHVRAPSVPEGYAVPEITDGYWVLFDRQNGKTGSIFDESRHSRNFTAAIWDADTSILYFLKADT